MGKSCAIPKGAFPVKFEVKSPSHALELARKLIRPFKHWTVGLLAADNMSPTYDGSEVEVKSPKAEAFCALGALRRVNTKHEKAAEKFLQQAAALIQGEEIEFAVQDNIFSVNDQGRNVGTHRTVLKMFTKAIHLAKKAKGKK